MDLVIRPMQREEFDAAIELAADEGWNPGLHDAACFHAADPGGFLVAEHRGAMVGCIGAVSYAGRFGFIGMFIVAPAWRGRGVGRALWDAGMARLAGHAAIGLDGVPQQQAWYRSNGFRLAWRNARCVGPARPMDAPAAPQIVPLAEIDFAAIAADDARVFPAPRDDFLRCWTRMPDAVGLAWQEHGQLVGWGLVRPCREGHKIGPLVADRPEVASALYRALCARVPDGDAVFLDVPLPNGAAVALAERLGLQRVFETARMYAGPEPRIALPRVYGITSFELG